MPGITETEFESIGNEYYKGTYAGFKVLIMKENGYINASKLCKDGDKMFGHWHEKQGSKDLIIELASSIDLPIELIVIKNMKGPYECRGSYVHRDLVPNIASWISPSFSLKVSRIVNEYLLKEEKEKHAIIVQQKDDKIDELKAKLDAVLRDTGEILDRNKELKSQVSDLTDGMTKLSLDNEITHEQLNEVQHTLDIVVEDRVVRPEDETIEHTIVIYESLDKGPNKFYIFRVQKRGFKAALSRYLKKNPNAVKFMEIEYNPNAINYYNRFKQEYKEKIISRYNDFELVDITKKQLKEFIEKVDDEKFEVENIK